MSQSLDHVAIRVKDMDRAIDYYLSLGFNLQWESDDWSFFEEGIALLGPGYNRAEPHFAFFLETHDELKKKWKELMDHGFSCCRPHRHRDGTVSFYTTDTEGNQLEFICQRIGTNP
jgi:catechol 2,3-dioxygenase-like lactoylglutathione lyase family enzyme